MGIIERLKTIGKQNYTAGSSVDINHVSPEQIAETVKSRQKGQVYAHPTEWTPETEREWAEKVYVGKIARNIITLAKNTMASELKSDDEKIQNLCSIMSRKVHLQTQLQKACIYCYKYGQTYIYPIYSDKSNTDLLKLKILYSPSVTVYRDSAKEIETLQNVLEEAKLPKISAKAGSGDEIVGFIQKINDSVWFFKPEEIIFVARYADGEHPNGYSILVQNADIISAKLQIEVDQTIMANRHGDPKIVFKLPAEWFKDPADTRLSAFKSDMNQMGIRAGMDIYLPDSDNPDEKADVSLLEATGNPQAVIKTQEHAENQFVAAFGLADSFTESTSSNRSVGEIQLTFFERDIAADRIMWAEILEDELINPWLEANGCAAGSAWFEFADLTPDDRLQKLQILAPQFAYLPDNIVRQVLEQSGYIVDDESAADEDPAAPVFNVNNLKRFGIRGTYSRVRGIPKKEADLIRYGRDAITEAAEAYRNSVKDQFKD